MQIHKEQIAGEVLEIFQYDISKSMTKDEVLEKLSLYYNFNFDTTAEDFLKKLVEVGLLMKDGDKYRIKL